MANCEDLATKAELQELRDQLNAIIGETEDGGTTEVFQAGVGGAGSFAQAAATVWAGTKLKAANAISDISFGSGVNPTSANLANGTAKLKLLKGGNNVVQFPGGEAITKLAGQNSQTVSLSSKIGLTGAQGVGLLANLVNLGATLALTKLTVDILDNRIEAEARGARQQIDAVNTSMIRLYDKQQGDINAVLAEIEANNEVVEQNRSELEVVRFDIANVQRTNNELVANITQANDSIRELRTANQELVEEINASNIENQEAFDNLTAQAQTLETQLNQAVEIIAQQQADLTLQAVKIQRLEDRTTELEEQFRSLSLSYVLLREDYFQFKDIVESEFGIAFEDITSLENQIANLQKTAVNPSAGGSPAAVTNAAANTQTSMLDLANKLVNPTSPNTTEITPTDIYNNTSTFQDTFEQLLTQLQPGTMNDEQLEQFRTDINTDFSTLLTAGLGVSVLPTLDTIRNQTTRSVLVESTEEALCRSLNGQSSCPATPGTPNPTQGLKGLKDALLGNIGAVNATLNTTILGFVQNTNSVVNSTTHGLAKIQSFAETAWKVTRADKVMQGVSLAMTIHNGMMLSNNLLSTVSEATNMTLNALGIRDETDTPIDIGAAVGSKITSILESILGAEGYAALTARIVKANRIYQSSINVLDTTYSLFDSARSVAELTAENTGKIGNALRESGAVYEDAYDEFIEKVNPQNAAMRRLDNFREILDDAENVFSTVNQISSEVVEFQENVVQLREEKVALKEEVTSILEAQVEEKASAREGAQVDTDIEDVDFINSREITSAE